MKNLITLILFLICSVSYAQKYTIVQINAKWNTKHDVQLENYIDGHKVIYGYLEDQNKETQKTISAVPIVILYKNNKSIKQWNADLSFKLNLTKEDIINAIRKDKQAHNSK